MIDSVRKHYSYFSRSTSRAVDGHQKQSPTGSQIPIGSVQVAELSSRGSYPLSVPGPLSSLGKLGLLYLVGSHIGKGYSNWKLGFHKRWVQSHPVCFDT